MTEYTFDDSTIAQIVQLIQLGMLTGTDVSDQIRTMRVVVDNNKILPSPDFVEEFNVNIDKMTKKAGKLSPSATKPAIVNPKQTEFSFVSADGSD